MKVIDLLNKIANGEEVPKKIWYEEYIWTWNGETYDNREQCLFEDYIDKKYVITDVLNDEIEIIEEEKDIEEIPIPEIDDVKNKRILRAEFKINELVRELNKIKKEDK